MSEYRKYRQAAIAFIEARNRRILRFCSEHGSTWPIVDTKSVPDRMEAVLQLAGQHGTRGQLENAMRVAAEKGLRVRAHKTCLMFTPASDATRCLFTLWGQPGKDGLKAWVEIEAFTEFFSVEPAKVEEQLGPAGWRHLDERRFDALLEGLIPQPRLLDPRMSFPPQLEAFIEEQQWTFANSGRSPRRCPSGRTSTSSGSAWTSSSSATSWAIFAGTDAAAGSTRE